MNPTTPRRLTVDCIAPTIAGAPQPAPQPLGTWFSRWHHVYADVPAPTVTLGSIDVTALPRPATFTIAA